MDALHGHPTSDIRTHENAARVAEGVRSGLHLGLLPLAVKTRRDHRHVHLHGPGRIKAVHARVLNV